MLSLNSGAIAAWRLTQRPAPDDDQRYSHLWHHGNQAGHRLAGTRPACLYRASAARRQR